MSPTDVVQALNRMIEFMCTRAEFRVMQVKASILATSKMNGVGVHPSPDKPPKQGDRQRDHVRGLAEFNSKDGIMVGDFSATDLAGMKSESRLSHIKAYQSWRTDPLGYMAYGQVNCKKDTAHYPAMWKYTSSCIQYQLTESTANLRILRLCGVYTQDPESDRHVLQKPVDVYNTTLSYGALMLGLTNWAAMELGVTVFDHNRLGRRWRCLPDDYLSLWPLLTNGFVIETSEHTDRLVDEVVWQHRWGWLMNQWKDAADVNSAWLDTHYSWNVPWWYVAAVADKFGHKFTCATDPDGELIMDEDYSFSDNMLGWLIEPAKSTQFDLSLLTSSSQYEKRVSKSKPAYFDILTPTSNGKAEAYHMLSWNPYFLQDTKKLQYRTRSAVSKPDYNGIVELNIVVFPSARIGKMKTCPRAFVSSENRIDGSDPNTYPFVTGGVAVIQRLLVGDYIGAINGGLSVIMDALNDWRSSSRFGGDSFRE
ncbi:GL24456 [Drosophila persimilis]|uniref:GL24456 n=1 Tax=Drosophila persimilis TaxID=7234 RepID=B4G3K0_DROPE|nr:GL24456 [Drosophila persimilis]